MNITSGKRVSTPEDEYGRTFNQARRLYDRLRKRSYRKVAAWEKAWYEAVWNPNVSDFVTDGDAVPWDKYEHEAYVAGVKDTLNAVLNLDD